VSARIEASQVAVPPAKARSDFRFERPVWTLPAAFFLLLFFIMPLFDNLKKSFTEGLAASNSLYYYIKIISDPYYRDVVISTFTVSGIVVLACILIGYPVAYFLVRYAGKWQPAIVFLLIAPLLTSIVMRTFGWQVILARRGLLNNALMALGFEPFRGNLTNEPIAVYIGLVHVLVPFMVLSIAPVLQKIGPQLDEAAQVLGAGRMRILTHITLPLSREGLLSGCILVFMLANGSFLTMLLLGGGSIITAPLLIYQQFIVTQDSAFAGAIGNILLLLSLICLSLQIPLAKKAGQS